MQQINLYLPEFRPRQDWLSLKFSVVYLAVLFVCMVLYQVIVISSKNHWREQVAALEAQQDSVQQQVDKLKKKSASESLASYEQQASTLREKIKNREAIAAVIGGQAFGNRHGFSAHLRSFSDSWLNGVVLSGFSLKQGGKYASLSGEASEAELVPLFIGRLRNSEVFSQTQFGLLSLQETATATIQFATSGKKSSESVSPRRGSVNSGGSTN